MSRTPAIYDFAFIRAQLELHRTAESIVRTTECKCELRVDDADGVLREFTANCPLHADLQPNPEWVPGYCP